MTDITPETFAKAPKLHPALATLPAYLKDPKNYDKVMKAILDAGATRHSHGEIADWAACAACQRKAWDRKEFMTKLGFKHAAQFKAWQQVHMAIKERVPLAKYNS